MTFYFNGNDPDLIENGLDLDYSNYAPGAENTWYTFLRARSVWCFEHDYGPNWLTFTMRKPLVKP